MKHFITTVYCCQSSVYRHYAYHKLVICHYFLLVTSRQHTSYSFTVFIYLCWLVHDPQKPHNYCYSPPSDRYFSSVYESSVHYICIHIFCCETLPYHVCIPQIKYTKTITVVDPNIVFVRNRYTQLPIRFLVDCSLYKHIYISHISPILPEHCYVTTGGIWVET